MKRTSAIIAEHRCRQLIGVLAASLILAGCSGNAERADAYGNFEATEILVSAEATGRLVAFDVQEARLLEAGHVVGLIDTLQLALQKRQLLANRRAIRSRLPGVAAQVAVLEKQKEVAVVEKTRLDNLFKVGAATQKQLDDIGGQIDVIDRQIRQAGTQNATIRDEVSALEAQVALVDDQIQKCVIVNPVRGTVLTTFAEQHELTAYGKPLYQIADLSTLELRAYVSGEQLPHITLGQAVEVQVDETSEENRSVQGEIVWIASESEFTPKLIQTKEERVNLVYAFKVRVTNPDGTLKIGMPGEVWFGR
jgi:HlyD family secretion protein